ncbi:helix-turn-helix transcriptional regulator [Leptospira sp. id769339]|uniref:helix-turn-helix domain-containing protein n=1 Tax=Leptospira sp. id769339 TaxID=2864221 RepID=UPI00214B0626|nr:helix-turn-helix domain-containing protein [Leptospira sp. id769339]
MLTQNKGRIKKLRLAAGLTQEDIDEGECAVHFRTIQEIENGRPNPNFNTLFRISKRLKVKPKDLFDF